MTRLVLDPSPSPAILEWESKNIGMRDIQFGAHHECLQVPVVAEFPKVVGIPAPESGIIYLVDHHVFSASDRSDVFTYSDEVGDGNGGVVIGHLIGRYRRS